jgi:CHAT domain-containing protein
MRSRRDPVAAPAQHRGPRPRAPAGDAGKPAAVLALAGALLLAACGAEPPALAVEEAKRIVAEFQRPDAIAAPEQTDDEEPLEFAEAAPSAEILRRAEAAAPDTDDHKVLADFYLKRGIAKRRANRAADSIKDLGIARRHAEKHHKELLPTVLFELYYSQNIAGSPAKALEALEAAIAILPARQWSSRIRYANHLAGQAAGIGLLDKAEEAARTAAELVARAEANGWPGWKPGQIAAARAHALRARATLAHARGRDAEGEALLRKLVAVLDAPAEKGGDVGWMLLARSQLASNLLRQGRLAEAEAEARHAVRGFRDNPNLRVDWASISVGTLSRVVAAQGRLAAAEALARQGIELQKRAGSRARGASRLPLAAVLAAQGRWEAALAEYDGIHKAYARDPLYFDKFFALNRDWMLALVMGGRAAGAVPHLRAAVERTSKTLGEDHARTAEFRGLLALALARAGEPSEARASFERALPPLVARASDDEESDNADRLAVHVIEGAMAFFAERDGDRATERLFEFGQSVSARSVVQRALAVGAARAALPDPGLADLARREQDAARQAERIERLVVALSGSGDTDGAAVERLREDLKSLRVARRVLAEEIARRFPAYAGLVSPKPVSLAEARAALNPGEALVIAHPVEDRTYLWAFARQGPVAFAVEGRGRPALESMVDELRLALEPAGAVTLGDLPPFDLGLAHALYGALLAPVEAGWREARRLVVVPSGAAAHVPWSLLPTALAEASQPREGEPLFAPYRLVPWLARRAAVSQVPSVGAFARLRALPPGDPKRRAFAGFGDPWFSPNHAEEARAGPPRGGTRGAFRSRPSGAQSYTARLAQLSRLPETVAEVREVAGLLGADPARDVFLGRDANERTVKSTPLSDRRVIHFATHGLVPGDLDGLAEPALALTAPELAGIDGDGLLTMDEILALKLDADWVLLSACNTAAGAGAGEEAVSGLGRAFFYAGARALLVSNWPVHSEATADLMRNLFRRQAQDRTLARAEALRQTQLWMIDEAGPRDGRGRLVFSYAHPIFWAPFVLVGDGG